MKKVFGLCYKDEDLRSLIFQEMSEEELIDWFSDKEMGVRGDREDVIDRYIRKANSGDSDLSCMFIGNYAFWRLNTSDSKVEEKPKEEKTFSYCYVSKKGQFVCGGFRGNSWSKNVLFVLKEAGITIDAYDANCINEFMATSEFGDFIDLMPGAAMVIWRKSPPELKPKQQGE